MQVIRTIVISLLLSLQCLSAFAVPARFQPMVDSLEWVQEAAPRLELLSRLSKEIRRESPAESYFYAEQGLQLARALNDTEAILQLLILQGESSRYQGKYDQAIALHQQALSLEHDTRGREMRGITYLQLALDYKRIGKYSLALTYQQAALSIFQAENLPAKVADSYNNLGNIYLQLGDYAQALEAQSEALAIRKAKGLKKDLGFSYHNIGLIYQFMGQYASAERFYEEALCSKESLSENRSATTFLNLGELFGLQGEYEMALEFSEECLRRASRVEHYPLMVSAYSNMGYFYLQDDNLPLAKQFLLKAFRLCLKTKDRLDYAHIVGRLGLLDIEQGLVESGLDSLKRSLELHRETDNRSGLVETLDRLKTAYLQVGQPLEALHWAEAKNALKDSLFSLDTQEHLAAQKIQLELDQQKYAMLQMEEAFEKDRLNYLWMSNALIAAFLLAIGVVLAYNNRRKTRVNRILSVQNEKIAQANFSLRHANQEMEQFLHILSHELKTPIRNIGGYVSLLRRRYLSQLDEDGQQFVNFAMEGVSSMNQLLTDLMEYAQIGHVSSSPQGKVGISQVVERVIQDQGKKIREYEARLDVTSLPELVVDYKSFYLVFRHLIDNALKFRRENVPLRIRVGYRSEPGRHVFWISDNGIGIEPAHQSRIFDLFQRLNPHNALSGTGFGLAACRKIIRQHKGEIWVESFPGDGTTFFINLPDPSWRKDMTFDSYSGARWIAGTNL